MLDVWSSTNNMSCIAENMSLGLPTRSGLNRTVQPQMRCLKFWIKKVEALFYQFNKNEVVERAADLYNCFRIMQKTGFLMTRLNYERLLLTPLLNN